jgi:hypothetical protein
LNEVTSSEVPLAVSGSNAVSSQYYDTPRLAVNVTLNKWIVQNQSLAQAPQECVFNGIQTDEYPSYLDCGNAY